MDEYTADAFVNRGEPVPTIAVYATLTTLPHHLMKMNMREANARG